MAASAKTGVNGEVLHQVAAQRLRALIVEGGIAPGQKLNERELAQRLQVSRTPLREALKLLTAEGLVEHQPNRGAIAVQLSAADLAHAFEVMAALEGLSGELACMRIGQAEVAELQALNYEMRAHHARRDLSAYYRVNAQIHRAINRAARNPVLTEIYDRLNARLQAFRFRSNFDAEKWDAAVREHEAMIDALIARDGARLRRVLIEHLQHKRDVVLAQIGQPAAAGGAPGRRRDADGGAVAGGKRDTAAMPNAPASPRLDAGPAGTQRARRRSNAVSRSAPKPRRKPAARRRA
jgi:DNA-binding GntR family transcriptional regulator